MKTDKQFENERKAKEAISAGIAKFEALVADGSLPGAKPYDRAILVMVALAEAGLVVRAARS